MLSGAGKPSLEAWQSRVCSICWVVALRKGEEHGFEGPCTLSQSSAANWNRPQFPGL